MKKRLLSMLLALVLVFGMIPIASMNVSAEFSEQYISAIGVCAVGSRSDALKKLGNDGYLFIDKDLNAKAGGKYIYIGTKMSNNYKDAITGIVIRVGKNPPESIKYKECDFYLLGGNKEKNAAGEGAVDLNKGAGGDYLYIYITRDTSFGSPIIEFDVSINQSNNGCSPVTDTNGNAKCVNEKGGNESSLYKYYLIFKAFSSMTYAGIRIDTTYFDNKSGKNVTSIQGKTVNNPDEKFYPDISFVPTEFYHNGMSVKLAGWNSEIDSYNFDVTSKNVSHSVNEGGNTQKQQFKRFQAIYDVTVKLTYDSNGGDITPSAQTVSSKAKASETMGYLSFKDKFKFKLTEQKPQKSGGCAFLGWSTDPDATYPQYTAGQEAAFNSDTTLYAVYDEHEYEYHSISNTVIEETCKNCDHTATATLMLDPNVSLEYTGEEIHPLKIKYSDNWLGSKNADIQYYSDCRDVGFQYGGAYIEYTFASLSFEIINGNMTDITVESYSGTYDDDEHGITVKNVPTGAKVTYTTSQNGNYSYVNPTFTDVGTYTVYYKVEKTNYNTVTGSASVTISKAQNSWIKEPGIDSWTYGRSADKPYTGTPKFGDDVKVEYKSADANDSEYTTTVPTQAGNYKARFTVEGNTNYTSLTKEIEFKIEKVKLTVKADDNSKTYGETDPTLTWKITSGALVGNDTLSSITVSRIEGENATSLPIPITVNQKNGANPNYEITFEPGNFTIYKKTLGISWGNTTFTYNGNPKCPTAKPTGMLSGERIEFTVTGEKTDVGYYTATVTAIRGKMNANYQLPDDVTKPFVINKADQAAPSGWEYRAETVDGKADGYIKNLTSAMEYRKDSEQTYTAINGTELTNLADGTYYIRYKEDKNHNASPDITVVLSNDTKLTVTVPTTQTGYTLTVSNSALKWNESTTITFALHDGYSKLNNFAVKVNGKPITLDNNGKYTVTDVQNNLTVTVEDVADITAPDTEITLVTNKWNKFFNNITFGLFFKDTQKVTVSASDKGSGLDKIYWYLSEAELTEEQVKALSDDKWTEYKGEFNINPQEEYIIYVKASDKDGNLRYISSEKGIVVDSIAPVISGIANGETHYGDTTFTVTDKHIDEVKVDGQPVTLTEGKYTITADDKEHTVIATDKSGNSSAEIKITVITIASLDDGIENITEDNVKSSDKQDIQDVLDFVNGLIDSGKDFTDAEDTQLADIKANAENLIKKIDDTAKEINDITDSVNAYETDKVKSDDKQDIEDLIDRIDSLNNTENVTESEKTALEEVKSKAGDLIKKIEDTASDVKDLTDTVNGYDKDKVTSDDKKNIEDLIDKIDKLLDGDNLNDSEKEELNKVKDTANGLVDKINEAADSSETENTDKVKDTTSDNVKPEDKKDLEKAKADLEKALDDYKDNLTNDEKKDIEKEIKRIEDALDVIEKVEDVEDLINKLPDTITKADADAVKKADEAYNALSDYEKSISDSNAKKKLDDAKAALEALNKANGSSEFPATGDNGRPWLWLALLFVSGGLFVTVLSVKRKKRCN